MKYHFLYVLRHDKSAFGSFQWYEFFRSKVMLKVNYELLLTTIYYNGKTLSETNYQFKKIGMVLSMGNVFPKSIASGVFIILLLILIINDIGLLQVTIERFRNEVDGWNDISRSYYAISFPLWPLVVLFQLNSFPICLRWILKIHCPYITPCQISKTCHQVHDFN